MNYKNYNDYELIYMVRENDSFSKDMLYEKYYPIISSITSEFYSKYKDYGYEYEDFYQEALYAFNKSIVLYDESKDTLFYTFMNICVKRHLLSFSRNISGKGIKNYVNSFVEIEKCEIEDEKSNIEKILESEDIKVMCKNFIYDTSLSILDTSILELKLNGFTYKEICKLLDMPNSTVQFKLRRIKNSLRKSVQNYFK